MKKIYLTLVLVCISCFVFGQCFVQAVCTTATCYGACDGSATAYANGVPTITYLWMPGGQTTQTITGLCAGTYTVTITDSLGCTATGQCTVAQPTQLQAMFTNYVNPSCASCCDGSVTGSASGGTPPYSYTLWPPTGPPYPFPQLGNACVGSYTLCVTDANGCTSCDTVTLSFSSGIAANNSSVNMKVSQQSPAVFVVNLEFAEPASGEIVVTNVLGEIVQRKDFSTDTNAENVIDLTACTDGIYFISVVTANGTSTQRVMKN